MPNDAGHRALAPTKEDNMSSTYLTSRDMNSLEQVLAEVRERAVNRGFDPGPAHSRMLGRASERGPPSSPDLGALLAAAVRAPPTRDHSSQRWENEGGGIRSE